MDNFLRKMLKFGARKLGIYVARDSISIVEVDDRRIVSQARVPLINAESIAKGQPSATATFSGGIQNTEAIEEALRSNKIKAKHLCLGLPAYDQFIRSFQMLMLSASEINLGIQFEVKKYIPFRTEDLAFDYQYRINKKTGKMDVLFVATTRNNLDNYFASLNEIGLTVSAVEPAGLSLLRILSLTKQLNINISFALVEVHGQEAEFTIIDKGFPCFSRELKLALASDADEASFRMRLTNEMRVSIDYYRRQFAGAQIDKVFFLSKNLAHQETLISGLSADLGLAVESVELSRDPEANSVQDLNMLKAYALALKDTVKINVRINLTTIRHAKAIVAEGFSPEAKAIAFNVNALKLPIAAALLIIGFAYLFPQIEYNKVSETLTQLQAQLKGSIPSYLANPTIETLKQEKINYSNNLVALDKVVKARSVMTPLLNALPRAISQGVWLESIDMVEVNNRSSIRIKGAVYAEDEQATPEIVKSFYKKLKSNSGLESLKLISVSQAQKGRYTVAIFEITGD